MTVCVDQKYVCTQKNASYSAENFNNYVYFRMSVKPLFRIVVKRSVLL